MTTGLMCRGHFGYEPAEEKEETTGRRSKDIQSRLFPFSNHRFLVLFVGLISLTELAAVALFATDQRTSDRLSSHSADGRAVAFASPNSHRSTAHIRPVRDKATAADALTQAVRQFIAAGETDDVTQRIIYLAPQVFFYGHKRTREQAAKQMTYHNRFWPQRRYAAPESVEVYAIPNRPDTYKVDSVYGYEKINRDHERLTGKARLTCIFEYGNEGPRIVGVDEKLVSGTTRLYRGSGLNPQ
jgi:hypothetical protein